MVQELFSERHYADLDGGILEGFGRLLKFDLKVYVYPTINEKVPTFLLVSRLQWQTEGDPSVQRPSGRHNASA
jgi:hypothetical protein